MPHKDARYNKFLSSYKFFTNSIEFRIISSKALEKWKNVQGFQLNQLVNGRFYFDQKQREILLLNYDLWSNWLYEVENYCIELSGAKKHNKISITDIDFIIELSKKTCDTFGMVVKSNPDKFDIKFTDVWLEQHTNVRTYMNNKIATFSGLSVNTCFTECVNLLTKIMQHSLIEIHELENLIIGKSNISGEQPFIIVNELDDAVLNKFGNCLISDRLKIYKKYFKIDEVCVKNYTENPINHNLADRIEATGTKINYKMSSRFNSAIPSENSTIYI